MKTKTTETKYVGMSGLTLLGIVFITLKLMGHIDWSWWYVLLPFYGLPLFLICAAVLFVSLAGMAKLLK